MVLGTHSAIGNHDHREWLLHRYDLQTSRPVTKEPLQLQNFFGSEIGSTACFTIYRDSFYALTTQTSFESEEVDWTSYYHFIKFAIDEPHPDLKIRVIWRRQHLEGPINDAWTDLGFQLDHNSGELLIVECRKEWLAGGSRSVRTYYTQPFHRAAHGELQDGLRHPPNDPLSRTLDAKSNSRWEAPWPRVDRYVHTETQYGNVDGGKEYIRAKTKWNGYHYNAQAFVDLVTDEARVEGGWRRKERIRLRVVSRHELSPLVPGGEFMDRERLVFRPRVRNKNGEEMKESEEAFSPSKVSLWPPDDAPQGLHDMLCPGGRAGDVKAVLGDEGLVYMVGSPCEVESLERALVFVSFDPTFGFQGMKRLNCLPATPKTPKNILPIPVRKRKPGSEAGRESVDGCLHDPDTEPALADGTKRHCTASGRTDVQSHSAQFRQGRRLPKNDLAKSAEELKGVAVNQAKGAGGLDRDVERSGKRAEARARHAEHLDQRPEHHDGQTVEVGKQANTPSDGGALTSGSGSASEFVADESSLSSRKLQTWRERAAYTAIKQGFWLR